MAVLSGSTASGRNMYTGVLTTTASTVVYTAPAQSTNVTSPSSTAYIKEMVISNYHASATAKVNIGVNGVSYVSNLSVAPGDTKILSGLTTMMNAGATITAYADTASAIVLNVSGTEVQ